MAITNDELTELVSKRVKDYFEDNQERLITLIDEEIELAMKRGIKKAFKSKERYSGSYNGYVEDNELLTDINKTVLNLAVSNLPNIKVDEELLIENIKIKLDNKINRIPASIIEDLYLKELKRISKNIKVDEEKLKETILAKMEKRLDKMTFDINM